MTVSTEGKVIMDKNVNRETGNVKRQPATDVSAELKYVIKRFYSYHAA